MALDLIEHKTGNGAFFVARDGDKFVVDIDANTRREFDSPRAAYEWCKSGYADLQGTMRGYSYLNAAHALEDVMAA